MALQGRGYQSGNEEDFEQEFTELYQEFKNSINHNEPIVLKSAMFFSPVLRAALQEHHSAILSFFVVMKNPRQFQDIAAALTQIRNNYAISFANLQGVIDKEVNTNPFS